MSQQRGLPADTEKVLVSGEKSKPAATFWKAKARASFYKNIDPELHSKDTYSKKMLVCACVFIF